MKLGWNRDYSEYISALYPSKKLSTRSITFQITDACNLNCSYCVVGDTTIFMGDLTYKPIKEVKVGDSVIGFDLFRWNGYWKMLPKMALVKHCFKRKVDKLLKVQTADGHILKITGNHRVLASEDGGATYNWKEIQNCQPNKSYLIYYGRAQEDPLGVLITSITVSCGNYTVYNIETETGNYFANNLAVHNCYQISKCHNFMNERTAKKCVDLLFDLWDKNDPKAIINHSTKAIILDYIGGEPLLNVPIMDFINSYFMERCIAVHHPWALTWRASICSNGLNYFNDDFQNYLRKWGRKTSFAITLDGPQEIHDLCRRDFNGEGSFERAYRAARAFKEKYGDEAMTTKITFCPENLSEIDQIFDFFVKENYKEINGNPAFEPEYTLENAKLYYRQLKKMADQLLNSGNEIHTNIFVESIGEKIPEDDLQNNCGGQGEMLAFDPQGLIYPCLRFMPSSLGDSRPPIVIGSIYTGLFSTEEQRLAFLNLKKINRRSKSSDKCFYCPVASGCADCAGWNYQENGNVNSRSTHICLMHKARVLANSYYWNCKWRREGSKKRFKINVAEDEALAIVGAEEFLRIKKLEK